MKTLDNPELDKLIATLPTEQKLHYLIGWVLGLSYHMEAMQDDRFADLIKSARDTAHLLQRNEKPFPLACEKGLADATPGITRRLG